MNGLGKLMISLSLSGTVLILLLALLRPLLRRRISWRWQYYIWLLVIVRLLLPFSPPESPAGNAVQYLDAAVLDVSDGSSAKTPEFLPEAGEPEPSPEPLQKWRAAVWENLWLIWLAGALGLLIRKVTAYQSFTRCIRAGWSPVEDPALLDRAAAVGAEIGVKRPVELYVNPLAASPMLLRRHGPCIVLPSAGLPEADFRYVVLHELTHCKRRDGLYKWLVQLTVCVHWFNPLVHWMSREISRTGELSCDEAVLKQLTEPERRAYGDALLRTLAAGGGYQAETPSTALGESGKLLKERLDIIMKYKKPTKLAAVLAALLAVVLGVTATAAGAYTGVPAVSGVWRDAGLDTAEHRFTMEALYQEPYIFQIGWNALGQGSSAVITLPDESKLTVWLSSGAEGVKRDAAAMKALKEAVTRLWQNNKGTGFPVASPMVFWYRNEGKSSAAELAEKYYKESDLPSFQAVFTGLNNAEKMAWLTRIYHDGGIAFFSVAADRLEADGDLVKALAEKAYKDGKISFFSVLTDRMSEDTLEVWEARAEKDQKTGFRAALLGKLEDHDGLEKMKDELDDQQAEEYARLGVTVDGKNRYYQGKLVNIFLDHQPESNCYFLDMNPKGSVNIKIMWDTNGKRTGVAYLTQSEITELFGDDFESVSWDRLREKDKDDDDWDWDDDWDDDWDWDDELDKQLADEYKKVGVTSDGKYYYYQGKLVNIFLDRRADSSFYTLGRNPKGTVNIKIVRDANNKITGVAALTQSEIADLTDSDAYAKYIVDTDIDSVKDGEFVWLGTFEMKKGDKVYYDVSAEKGKNLTVGFAKAGDQSPATTYTTVSNNRMDGELQVVSGPLEWGAAEGGYSLFIHAKSGSGVLEDISAHIWVTAAE